eukprot:scaffold332932_cov43-Attheya_sp.AAC.1
MYPPPWCLLARPNRRSYVHESELISDSRLVLHWRSERLLVRMVRLQQGDRKDQKASLVVG